MHSVAQQSKFHSLNMYQECLFDKQERPNCTEVYDMDAIIGTMNSNIINYLPEMQSQHVVRCISLPCS